MDNKFTDQQPEFTEQELEYINADVFDKSQQIYAYCVNTESKILPNIYTIKCLDLPKGKYDAGLKVNFHFNTRYYIAYGHFHDKLHERYSESGRLKFDIIDNCDVLLKTKLCKRPTVEEKVYALRTQIVLNTRKLNKESLIQQDIKTHTDLGEAYNRESFYSTINECIVDEIPINIDPTNTLIDADTISLHSAQLIQRQTDIARRKRELFAEQKECRKALEELKNQAQSLNK